jgi:alpha-amylase/alpha-mannosidase (GH57 family)
MATVSFLWHLHQPGYRTADQVSHAPWAALHAGGAYTTLARAIEHTEGRGQVLNIVPTLLEQLLAYAAGEVEDPVLDAVLTPVADLSSRQRETLVDWGRHVNPRQLARYPRLNELARRRPSPSTKGRIGRHFGPGDLRDLQILFVLALAGEQAWTDPRLEPLHRRGTGFGTDDHEQMTAWLSAQPTELIQLWRRIAALPGVEISTSPYAHPIMPLLIDTAVVSASWAPYPAPIVPDFEYPEDARRQLAEGLDFMREHGFETGGCWPPEGSVSTEALALYSAAGVRWLVTDEGILERSLDRPLRNGGGADGELYRSWLVQGHGPVLFFRDRRLSDDIGFHYGRWDDEGHAAKHLVRELEELARGLPPEACITIALDGENPWLYYPEGGGRFLRELFDRLNHAAPVLAPATLDDVAASSEPQALTHLHPGSWINSIFATWIGHPEKTRAWEVLAEVRHAIARHGVELPPSLLLAEGSDWFWWLGDDNPTALAPLYDRIFRRHLADACEQTGIEPPVDLSEPLKTATQGLRVPVSDHRPPPILDGRITSYFEWASAAWLEGTGEGPLTRLALRAGRGSLHILVEGGTTFTSLIDRHNVFVRLLNADGGEIDVQIGKGGVLPTETACALGRVLELSLPWDCRPGSRLDVRLGEWHLPAGAALLLEPAAADREYTDDFRKD